MLKWHKSKNLDSRKRNEVTQQDEKPQMGHQITRRRRSTKKLTEQVPGIVIEPSRQSDDEQVPGIVIEPSRQSDDEQVPGIVIEPSRQSDDEQVPGIVIEPSRQSDDEQVPGIVIEPSRQSDDEQVPGIVIEPSRQSDDEQVPGIVIESQQPAEEVPRTRRTTIRPVETEEDLPPPRRRSRRLLWLIIGIAAAVIAFWFLILPIFNTQGTPAATPPTPVPTERSQEPSPIYPTSAPIISGQDTAATQKAYTATTTSTALPATATRLLPTIQATIAPSRVVVTIQPTPSTVETSALPYPGPVENNNAFPPTATITVAAAESTLVNSTDILTSSGVFTQPVLLKQIFQDGDFVEFNLKSGKATAEVAVFNSLGENKAGYQVEIVNGKLPLNLGKNFTAQITIIPSGDADLEVIRIPAKLAPGAAECDEDGCN